MPGLLLVVVVQPHSQRSQAGTRMMKELLLPALVQHSIRYINSFQAPRMKGDTFIQKQHSYGLLHLDRMTSQ